MRLVVTRPQTDGERTAETLRARGHVVLTAPLMRIEALPADLSGTWSAIATTSANALLAVPAVPMFAMLHMLPVYAVGQRSAEAARTAGFRVVIAAAGDARDLVRLIAERHVDRSAPLLYLAGEDRAADVVAALASHGIAAVLRVVYRAAALPFPPALIAALQKREIDGVLHFSKRSAESYLQGAISAGIAEPALIPKHYCLSAAVAAPLAAAGARDVSIAAHPSEASLIELLPPPAA